MCAFLSDDMFKVGMPVKPISIPEAVTPVVSTQGLLEPSVDACRIRYPAEMTEADGRRNEPRPVGLCLDCLHSQRIQTGRGSTFYRCKLSDTDSSFSKYPRLPVLQCVGYARKV
jgi:hypothetical protein